MSRAFCAFLVALSFAAFSLSAQTRAPETKSAAPSADALIQPAAIEGSTIWGKVIEMGGAVVAGATVTVSNYSLPSQSLAETKSDSRGDFMLQLPVAEPLPDFVLKGSLPSGLEGYELTRLAPLGGQNALVLKLRKPESGYDDPNMDAVEDWLLTQLKQPCGSKPRADCAAGTVAVLTQYKKVSPPAWDRVRQSLEMADKSDAPERRLLAASALMRLGAWKSADEMLRRIADDRFSTEKALLEGVRFNFEKVPRDAEAALTRTLRDDMVDPLVQLEWGRAALLEEDWPGALQRLDPAIKSKKLEPLAHYLRARALFALGDVEAASAEVKLLTRRVKKKKLPANARIFVEDLLERLDEKSIRPIQSVMTQPIPELQKAVPSLANMDSSPPLEGPDLSMILNNTGQYIEKFFREFANTSSLEVLRQSTLDNKGQLHAVRRAEMYYVFQQKSAEGRPMLEEIRGSSDGQPETIGGLDEGFMATTGFASSLVIFHPISQPTVDYRYLGQQMWAGRRVYVVGFAQRPGQAIPMGVFRSTAQQASARVFVQGMAWISTDQFQVVRLRTDLLAPIQDAGLDRQTSEIDYRPYQFLTNSKTYVLPSRVTVSIEWHKRRLRNEHIFSRFWLFNVEADSSDEHRVTNTAKIPQPVAAH